MGKAPLFVRPPTDAERQALEDSLRSPDAFVLRRAQIILASAQGEQGGVIAPRVGFSGQAVRDVIHAFNAQGVAVLRQRSRRNRIIYRSFDTAGAEALRALLHRSPRDFDKPTGVWALDLAAEVAHEQGLIAWRVSGETLRATLARRGVRWRRALLRRKLQRELLNPTLAMGTWLRKAYSCDRAEKMVAVLQAVLFDLYETLTGGASQAGPR
jgi:transposase